MIRYNCALPIVLIAAASFVCACSNRSQTAPDSRKNILPVQVSDGPATTICRYHWSEPAVAWRSHTFTDGDCSNGTPLPGSTGVGQNENTPGLSGDWHCWSDGWHYNHPQWVGLSDGTVRCFYSPPPSQAQPNTAVTTCSFQFSSHSDWVHHDWEDGDCSNGVPAPGASCVGNGYTGSGLGGMVDCSESGVGHYNHPAYDGETDALATCTCVDPTPVENPELTVCQYHWDTPGVGWRVPHIWTDEDCSPHGRPTPNASAVGQSTNGSGQPQQASCTPTSGSQHTVDSTVGTVHCLFQNYGDLCTPRTCQEQQFNCGVQDDGCGGTHDCGTCYQPLTCGGGGRPGVCGTPTGSLQYFGYWRDNDLEPFGCETQTHANYTMGYPLDDGRGVAEAEGWGVSFFLALSDRNSATALQATRVAWIADDAENAANVWCVNHPEAHCPGLNNICCWNGLKAKLEADAADFHSQYPNMRFAINLLGDFRRFYPDDFTLPQGITEIAYECYGTPSMTAEQTRDDCRDMVTRTPLRPGDRVWILPPGEAGAGTEDLLMQKAQALYDWTRTDPRVVGLTVFWWNHGVRDLPRLKALYMQIGTAITGRLRPVPPNCPPPP